MKKITLVNMTISSEMADIIDSLNIDTTISEDEDGEKYFLISDEDYERLNEALPFADWDVSEYNEKKYDVIFNDDTSSNSKLINSSFADCMNWINANKNDESTYFGDYKGGTVSIVCLQTDETVYEENIN